MCVFPLLRTQNAPNPTPLSPTYPTQLHGELELRITSWGAEMKRYILRMRFRVGLAIAKHAHPNRSLTDIRHAREQPMRSGGQCGRGRNPLPRHAQSVRELKL